MDNTPQSKWTLESLKEHFEARLNEWDKRLDQRFESQEKAIHTANTANEKRLDSVNEFRGQLKDQSGDFMRKVQADERFTAIEARMKIMEDAALKIVGKGTGSQQLWVIILAVVGLVAGLIGIAARFF